MSAKRKKIDLHKGMTHYADRVFSTLKQPAEYDAAIFIPKNKIGKVPKEKDWLVTPYPFSGDYISPSRADTLSFLKQLAVYKVIEKLTKRSNSSGTLFLKYFPPSLIKVILLQEKVLDQIDAITFLKPSHHHGLFFSAPERSLLNDLYRLHIPVYWFSDLQDKLLRYSVRAGKNTGMFTPIDRVYEFENGSLIGVYGSHLISGSFSDTIRKILIGLKKLQKQAHHPLLNPDKPLVLLTGGGPGVMEVANQIATEQGVLSCANIVDFTEFLTENYYNPYAQSYMTYRLEELIERQSDFSLDFPIFTIGGYGTDFELALEEAERKVRLLRSTPAILLGPASYWKNKITPRFQLNLKMGTIRGSEWISNCFYSVENAKGALQVYQAYVENRLPIGRDGPVYEDGFCIWKGEGTKQ